MLDPFTKVFNAINAELKRDRYKVVDWNSSRDPEPEIPTENDLPEVQLRPTGLSVPTIGNASCSTSVNRSYTLLINSGDQRSEILFAIEWRLLKTMHSLKYGTPLNDLPFVLNVEIRSAQSGLSNAIENRGIKGWTALWSIEVLMSFSAAELT